MIRTVESVAEQIITAILVHGFENDADAERVLREQQSGVTRLLARALVGGPSIDTTATTLTPEAMQRGRDVLKAGDAHRRADTSNIARMSELLEDPAAWAAVMGFELQPWQQEFLRSLVGHGAVKEAARKTAYTVAREAGAHTKAQEWLIAPDEVKIILDGTVRVGTADGKNMVFNKRDAANKIAQIVNDRFNAKKGA